MGRGRGEKQEGDKLKSIDQQVAVGVASTLARTVKASGSRIKISLFSVATTRQLTASSSEWLFFIVAIATMTDCVCVGGGGQRYNTITQRDGGSGAVCARCVLNYVCSFGSGYLSLQWYMFEDGGERLKVVWLKLK